MQDNKSIVRGYLDEVWGRHNLAAIDEYIAPDFVQHTRSAPPGRDGVKAFFAMLSGSFSNLDFRVEDTFGEGDRVCWRWSLRAQHTALFQGIPPTGRTVTIEGISIARLADGRIVEHWGEQDMLGLMQQLRG